MIGDETLSKMWDFLACYNPQCISLCNFIALSIHMCIYIIYYIYMYVCIYIYMIYIYTLVHIWMKWPHVCLFLYITIFFSMNSSIGIQWGSMMENPQGPNLQELRQDWRSHAHLPLCPGQLPPDFCWHFPWKSARMIPEIEWIIDNSVDKIQINFLNHSEIMG